MLVRSDIVDIFLKAINGLSSAFSEGLRLPNSSRDGRLSSAFSEGPVTARALLLPRTIDGIDDTRHRNSGKKASMRIFISDWELRRLYKPAEKSVHVPQCAIISPLSRDWLEYEGIEVIFDETGK